MSFAPAAPSPIAPPTPIGSPVPIDPPVPQVNRLHEYWDALAAIIADLSITNEEAAYLLGKRQQLGLHPEEIRSVHARAYAKVISQFTEDRRIDERECRILNRLQRCLSQLGWAPGEV